MSLIASYRPSWVLDCVCILEIFITPPQIFDLSSNVDIPTNDDYLLYRFCRLNKLKKI